VSAKSKGRSRLAIKYFDDRLLLTDMHAWAYYRVPSVSYEFTTPDEREALATNITVALAAIRMQDAEVHLRIAHRPYPAVDWATGLDNTSDGGPGWREYLEEIYQHVWAKDFWSKEIYLGVRLGQRSVRAQLTDGLFGNLFNTYKTADHTKGHEEAPVPAGEIGKWTDQAERLGRALTASALSARHATSRELAWLFRHTLMGSLGDPPPSATRRRTWLGGEIEQLYEGSVHNGRTMLRLEQVQGDSWVAFLSFSRFPDLMSFPDGEPWLHYDPPGQGVQGRVAAPGARPRHGRAHPRGGRGGADRPRGADRRRPHARARHHEGAAALRLRLAPADRDRADQGAVRSPG
jgi:hypothetical protein